MDRDELLRAAIVNLLKAIEAGGYIGYETDIQRTIFRIERIRTRLQLQ